MRWCAAALGAMERQFRRVKHYRHLPLLKRALQDKLVLTKLRGAKRRITHAALPKYQLLNGTAPHLTSERVAKHRCKINSMFSYYLYADATWLPARGSCRDHRVEDFEDSTR